MQTRRSVCTQTRVSLKKTGNEKHSKFYFVAPKLRNINKTCLGLIRRSHLFFKRLDNISLTEADDKASGCNKQFKPLDKALNYCYYDQIFTCFAFCIIISTFLYVLRGYSLLFPSKVSDVSTLFAPCWNPLKLTGYVLILIICRKTGRMEEIKRMLVVGALKGTASVYSIQILIIFFLSIKLLWCRIRMRSNKKKIHILFTLSRIPQSEHFKGRQRRLSEVTFIKKLETGLDHRFGARIWDNRSSSSYLETKANGNSHSRRWQNEFSSLHCCWTAWIHEWIQYLNAQWVRLSSN